MAFFRRNLSKEELTERLKAIAKEEPPAQRIMGAMCYSTIPAPDVKIICDRCGKTFMNRSWDRDSIADIVKKIARLGYDAKLELLCSECCEKVANELYGNQDKYDEFDDNNSIFIPRGNGTYLFYFRTNENESYHRALANNISYYKAVLAFLDGKSSYRDSFDAYNYLVEEINVLEFMTGLKAEDND